MAEVLEHLARVEKGLAKLVALKLGEMQSMANPPKEGPDAVPVDVARFGGLTDRTAMRLDAPERVRPTGEVSAEAARAVLMTTRGLLLDQLHAADGLALSQIVHPHQFFGPLDLYEWLYFLAGHEQRHTAQIREIAQHFSTV